MKKLKENLLSKALDQAQMKDKRLLEPINPDNQKYRLLELLKTGQHLSKKQIWQKLELWDSGNAVYLLRKEGYDIKTEMIKHHITGVRFAAYYLEGEK